MGSDQVWLKAEMRHLIICGLVFSEDLPWVHSQWRCARATPWQRCKVFLKTGVHRTNANGALLEVCPTYTACWQVTAGIRAMRVVHGAYVSFCLTCVSVIQRKALPEECMTHAKSPTLDVCPSSAATWGNWGLNPRSAFFICSVQTGHKPMTGSAWSLYACSVSNTLPQRNPVHTTVGNRRLDYMDPWSDPVGPCFYVLLIPPAYRGFIRSKAKETAPFKVQSTQARYRNETPLTVSCQGSTPVLLGSKGACLLSRATGTCLPLLSFPWGTLQHIWK